MKHYGTLAIPSGRLFMGDPCYIRQDVIDEIKAGDASQSGESVLDLRVPGSAEVHYDVDPSEGRLAAVYLFFTEPFDLTDSAGEELEVLGVDSGQMSYCDAEYLGAQWTDGDYVDIRKYRHKTTGDILQYMVDFPHYEAPIASQDGKTMNQLNTTGEWESMPYDHPIDVSYNGMCHCHDDGDDLGRVDDHVVVSGSGYGDGQYEVLMHRAEDGSIGCISITFIGEDDEDEDDWDFDDENEEDEN